MRPDGHDIATAATRDGLVTVACGCGWGAESTGRSRLDALVAEHLEAAEREWFDAVDRGEV